jgi:hypothetical protein
MNRKEKDSPVQLAGRAKRVGVVSAMNIGEEGKVKKIV